MKLVALLSWYDEDPRWLGEMIASLRLIGVDSLIAVDGRYSTFAPESPAISDSDQVRAITAACRGVGINYETYTPAEPWESEVSKRAFLFARGEAHGADWYFVIDADEFIENPLDVKTRLAATELDVAAVTLREHARHSTLRMFFRAIPGLTVQGTHHSYVTPDGRRLWGGFPMEPAHDIRELFVFHRNRERRPIRRDAAEDYYRHRDAEGIERGECIYCGSDSVKEIPTDWRRTETGLSAKRWVAVCVEHEEIVRGHDAEVLRSYGLDPAAARVAFRPAEEVFA